MREMSRARQHSSSLRDACMCQPAAGQAGRRLQRGDRPIAGRLMLNSPSDAGGPGEPTITRLFYTSAITVTDRLSTQG